MYYLLSNYSINLSRNFRSTMCCSKLAFIHHKSPIVNQAIRNIIQSTNVVTSIISHLIRILEWKP